MCFFTGRHFNGKRLESPSRRICQDAANSFSPRANEWTGTLGRPRRGALPSCQLNVSAFDGMRGKSVLPTVWSFASCVTNCVVTHQLCCQLSRHLPAVWPTVWYVATSDARCAGQLCCQLCGHLPAAVPAVLAAVLAAVLPTLWSLASCVANRVGTCQLCRHSRGRHGLTIVIFSSLQLICS